MAESPSTERTRLRGAGRAPHPGAMPKVPWIFLGILLALVAVVLTWWWGSMRAGF